MPDPFGFLSFDGWNVRRPASKRKKLQPRGMMKQLCLTAFPSANCQKPTKLWLFTRCNKHLLMMHWVKVYSAFLWHYNRNPVQPFLQKQSTHYRKGSVNIGGSFLQVFRERCGLQGAERGQPNGGVGWEMWRLKLIWSIKEMFSCFLCSMSM